MRFLGWIYRNDNNGHNRTVETNRTEEDGSDNLYDWTSFGSTESRGIERFWFEVVW